MKPLQISDPEMLAQLRSTGQVDVADGNGLLLGRLEYKPIYDPEFGLSSEEIDKLIADPNTVWIPADEVLARLKSRMKNGGNPCIE